MKKIMMKNFIFGIIIGVLINFGFVVIADSLISSSIVNYSNSKTTETTVEGALDELFSAVDINEQIGTNDISSLDDGTITGAILALKDEVDELKNSSIDVDDIYPVGSIYISVKSTNPGSIIGGTWVAFGSGRTLVGVNTSDTAYSTVQKTGGSSTVTLTTANLPNHTHSIPALTGTAASAGAHGYHLNPTGGNYYLPISALGTYNSRPYTLYSSNEAALVTQTLGAHTHSVTTTASTTGSTGSASAVSIQNPYITVYMWKRTA